MHFQFLEELQVKPDTGRQTRYCVRYYDIGDTSVDNIIELIKAFCELSNYKHFKYCKELRFIEYDNQCYDYNNYLLDDLYSYVPLHHTNYTDTGYHMNIKSLNMPYTYWKDTIREKIVSGIKTRLLDNINTGELTITSDNDEKIYFGAQLGYSFKDNKSFIVCYEYHIDEHPTTMLLKLATIKDIENIIQNS